MYFAWSRVENQRHNLLMPLLQTGVAGQQE